MLKNSLRVCASVCLLAGLALIPTAAHGNLTRSGMRFAATGAHDPRTPIRHLVVIFQENVSFDHYFGTYPAADNTDGQTFHAAASTPSIDGLTPALLNSNPNSAPPLRLDSSPTGLAGSPGGQLTCDQDHDYADEQTAFDGGKMDRFVESVGTASGTIPGGSAPCKAVQVMDYYDGNTVTGLWSYAQKYSMSDNSYGTTFGPSSPGAINLVAGDTSGIDKMVNSPAIATPTSPNGEITPSNGVDGTGGYTMIGDPQPYDDDCSTRDAVSLTGTNVGDELNTAGVSWGWFQGGQRASTSYADALAAIGKSGQPTSTFTPDEFKSYFATAANRPLHSSNQALCSAVHPVGVALGGTGQYGYKDDYIPHHEPFDYYASTANPHHLTLPTDSSGKDTLAGLQTIGTDTQSYAGGKPQFDTPNHNYDTSDFDQLVEAIQDDELPPSALPAVSFLKAPGYQDGHGGYSDPEDEQRFITREINALMHTPDWAHTAVLVNYDDSDGWYDHAFSGVTNPSMGPSDNLTNTTFSGPTSGLCGGEAAQAPLGGAQGRCGFGPRLPMLLISPFAKHNAVDHNLSSQSSILQLVEYNWDLSAIPGSADQALSGRDIEAGIPFDLAGLFDFGGPANSRLFLDPNTGQPVHSG